MHLFSLLNRNRDSNLKQICFIINQLKLFMMKKMTILLIAIFSLNMAIAQITSTTTGGNWHDASTWIGGVLPTANDDVVIDGTVYHNNKLDVCKNLTVNADKILTTLNAKMTGWSLKIMGDLINNGSIQNNNDSRFQIGVAGNIINNGVLTNYGIHMNGNSDQTISGTEPIGAYFMQITADNKIVAGSDLSFLGTTLLFYKNNEFLVEPGKTVSISFSDAHIQGEFMPPTNRAQGVQFTGGGTVKLIGQYSVDESNFDGLTLIKE